MMSVNRWKIYFLAGIGLSVLVLDQITKYWIYSRFHWGESVVVIPNFFAITYVRNMGAAFGFLHRAPEWFRTPFFLVVPLIILAVLSGMFIKLKPEQKWMGAAISLIISGAIGNIIDRARFGYVVDFLDFHYKEVYHWPAFNVADSSIVVGVCLIFLISWFEKKPSPSPIG